MKRQRWTWGGRGGIALLCAAATLAQAAGPELDHAMCPPAFGPVLSWGMTAPAIDSGETHIEADRMTGAQREEFHFAGNVEVLRDDERLRSDEAWYTRSLDQMRTRGDVLYALPGQIVTAESGTFNLGRDRGMLDQVEFWLTERHLRGGAQRADTRKESMELDQAYFTTCADGENDWILKTRTLFLDYANNVGIARHARLIFMHVPVFYSPYFTFPLFGRKSGFLVPTIGYGEGRLSEYTQPYYWNIAPHRDATITPRYLDEHGLLWQTQFRYLNPQSAGQIDYEYIGDDEATGEARSFRSFLHSTTLAQGLRGDISAQRVSDPDYLDTFGDDLSTASTRYLETRADLTYRAQQWQALGRVQEYQILDEDLSGINRPYQRLPQLLFNYQSQNTGPLQLQFESELVNFEDNERVTGTRLDLKPSLSFGWQAPAGFLLPKISLRDTRYWLGERFGGAEETSRTLPIFELDGGLFFERDLDWGDGATGLQTLEPRLFYLYVPYRDQDELVLDEDGNSRVFDTKLAQFSFASLFRDNRFSGADRHSDANQLSAALTTRVLDPNGLERLRASIGEIFYFDDREVTLPGGAVDLDSHSDLVGELALRPTDALSARATLQWDTKTQAERGVAHVQYQPDARQMVALSYYYHAESIRQADLAVLWPLGDHWRLLGRWRYSLFDELNLERIRGLEYDTCCWAFRLVQRYHRSEVEDAVGREAIWFQIEFKGLTSIGSRIEDYITRDILSPSP